MFSNTEHIALIFIAPELIHFISFISEYYFYMLSITETQSNVNRKGEKTNNINEINPYLLNNERK